MKTLRLSRRALLRGAAAGGITVGLPPLEAMFRGDGKLHATARAAAADPPVRLMTFFWPNGAYMEEFTPTTVGPDYALPKGLAPLASVKKDFLVVTGLKNVGSLKGKGDSHEKGRVCFATAVPSPSGQSAGGPSLEQYAAQKLGSATRFPSLVLAPVNGQGGNSAQISWAGPNQPVAPDIKPPLVFAKLFTNGADPALSAEELASLRQRRRSVLDFVRRDAARLNARLGVSDKRRVDAHLEAVRDIEHRLGLEEKQAMGGGPMCTTPVPPKEAKEDPWQWTYSGAPLSRYALLEDLLVAAFRCDLTRYASIRLNVDINKWIRDNFPGETRAHHDLSHDNGARAIQTGYTSFQMGLLASLMAKLKATPDGEKTLLDNVIIYAGSEISHGGAHNYTNMPVIVAGHGGGKIKTGRHVNLLPFLTPGKFGGVSESTWSDLGGLFLTLLGAAGVQAPSWGEATRPIDLG